MHHSCHLAFGWRILIQTEKNKNQPTESSIDCSWTPEWSHSLCLWLELLSPIWEGHHISEGDVKFLSSETFPAGQWCVCQVISKAQEHDNGGGVVCVWGGGSGGLECIAIYLEHSFLMGVTMAHWESHAFPDDSSLLLTSKTLTHLQIEHLK